jgi:UDPglucose--hexose-1-phosphate uridylyltransferase
MDSRESHRVHGSFLGRHHRRVKSELRQDPCTRNWVVIAPTRSQRPHAPDERPLRQLHVDRCPFCPGRESETPPEVWRLASPAGGWRVRVVPNRFALLTPDGSPRRQVSPEGFVGMPGIGHHEVIIESPDHSADLARGEDADVRAVLEAYRARFNALRRADTSVIVIFRNHGPAAGTSLAHPHSQIVATPVVPIDIRHRFEVAMQHYDAFGTCLYTDVLDRELGDGRRIVLETPRFVAFQPFASAMPFETWIMPRDALACFGDATDATLDDLARALHAVLAGLAEGLGDPDYNAVLQSAPVRDENREYFIWHLRILPRLAIAAGFELGSGMPVNPTQPEDTAAALRRFVQRHWETSIRAER